MGRVELLNDIGTVEVGKEIFYGVIYNIEYRWPPPGPDGAIPRPKGEGYIEGDGAAADSFSHATRWGVTLKLKDGQTLPILPTRREGNRVYVTVAGKLPRFDP